MISVCCAYVSFVSDQPQQKGQGGEAMVTVHSRQDIDGLSDLVRAMVGDGVLDGRLRFSEWARGNRDFVDSKLAYEQAPGMPPASALIKPFVHPSVPLVGLNYTPTAHNLLHRFFGGWTRPVRACRGIVFDRGGNLVGLPFPKFFNHGEYAETTDLPDKPWTATTKMDGHLVPMFQHGGKVRITTRGDFLSPTAILARPLIARHVRKNNWKDALPEHVTVLTELVHPKTSVFVDYAGRQDFVVVGAYNTQTLEDYDYPAICDLAARLNLPVTGAWHGNNLVELLAHMKDRSVTNQEGFVIRFGSGLRVKVKFETYIGQMVAAKLSYKYVMQRFCASNAERMLGTLPEEIYDAALRMMGEIMLSVSAGGTMQEQWRRLYLLELGEKRTASFEQACRKFVKKLHGVDVD
ncbi:MAG: hypothetical protein A3A33_03135 [Candidatus Yanofskybacteria bacterium RIFCSPLOWO2_01_FULL_49_25]|uniref:T4 RNA ligase 1-like N-terminal domain-containing protein n=1 Tax=Candidatus Yanofskybacteria bacterium RIFCSPLOWO2_01_FULL_49_25 TaxID=1802701 RepID=A0A1F8GUT1_9BACT|nr:MAG: hypothetical protein A3A33_03135 [Candidatus Yanofskybacteria bacterium RIFCSPLOWO2_01_FULL_49_25]